MFRYLLFSMMLGIVTADASEHQTGDGWTALSRPVSSGEFDRRCILWSAPGDLRIRLVNPPDSKVSTLFGRARFDVFSSTMLFDDAKRSVADVNIKIDDIADWPGVDAKWHIEGKTGTLIVPVELPIHTVLPAVARGKLISVLVNGKVLSLSLDGSYKAVVAYEKCLSETKRR